MQLDVRRISKNKPEWVSTKWPACLPLADVLLTPADFGRSVKISLPSTYRGWSKLIPTNQQLRFFLMLHQYSKTRNWIIQQILATFTSSKFVLGAVIYSFLTHLRTRRMAQRKWRNEMIRCTPPPASLLKNPKLNYSANTGHIYKL